MSSNLSQLKQRIASLNGRKNTVRGIFAMDHMQHGQEVAMEIITPIGRRLKVDSQLIGFDDQTRRIYFTLPELTPREFDDFLVEGYWAGITSVCEQGEGSLVRFKNRIENILTEPVQLMSILVPDEADIFELRQEMRYQIDMPGTIPLEHRQLQINICDISMSGCRVKFTELAPFFDVDSDIQVKLLNPENNQEFKLTGEVRNMRRLRGQQLYGIQFDKYGKQVSQQLLSLLIFNGSKLVFNSAKTAIQEAK